MADTLHFEIVSPERLLKDAQAAMVVVPGADGDFAAMPEHAPMMSTIRPGVVEIYETEGAQPEQLFVKGGLAQISPDGLTILAEEAIHLEEVDAADLAQKIADVESDLAEAVDEVARTAVEKELAWMAALSEIVSS